MIFGPQPAWDGMRAGFKSEHTDVSGEVQIHAVGCSLVRRGAGTRGLRVQQRCECGMVAAACMQVVAAACKCECGHNAIMRAGGVWVGRQQRVSVGGGGVSICVITVNKGLESNRNPKWAKPENASVQRLGYSKTN